MVCRCLRCLVPARIVKALLMTSTTSLGGGSWGPMFFSDGNGAPPIDGELARCDPLHMALLESFGILG